MGEGVGGTFEEMRENDIRGREGTEPHQCPGEVGWSEAPEGKGTSGPGGGWWWCSGTS